MSVEEKLKEMQEKMFPGYPEHSHYGVYAGEWADIVKAAFDLGVKSVKIPEDAKKDPYHISPRQIKIDFKNGL